MNRRLQVVCSITSSIILRRDAQTEARPARPDRLKGPLVDYTRRGANALRRAAHDPKPVIFVALTPPHLAILHIAFTMGSPVSTVLPQRQGAPLAASVP